MHSHVNTIRRNVVQYWTGPTTISGFGTDPGTYEYSETSLGGWSQIGWEIALKEGGMNDKGATAPHTPEIRE